MLEFGLDFFLKLLFLFINGVLDAKHEILVFLYKSFLIDGQIFII